MGHSRQQGQIDDAQPFERWKKQNHKKEKALLTWARLEKKLWSKSANEFANL